MGEGTKPEKNSKREIQVWGNNDQSHPEVGGKNDATNKGMDDSY